MGIVRACILTLAATVGSGIVLYASWPARRGLLLDEDGLVESLTAAVFLAGFAVHFVPRLTRRQSVRPVATRLLAAVCLLGFLDELSFGERLFRMRMPQLSGVKIDGAHDFFYVFAQEYWRGMQTHPAPVFLATLGIAAVAGWFVWRRREALVAVARNILRSPAYRLVGLGAVLVAVALVIDLDLVSHDLVFALEELAEMNAALALLFAGFAMRRAITVPHHRVPARKSNLPH